MATPAVTEFFDQSPSGFYDEKNKKLAPIIDNLHFLTHLVLKNLPANARILCVGVGTGAEIIGLARLNPGWTFDGIEPSQTMIQDCQTRLEKEGLTSRCNLFKGYLNEFKSTLSYDAVLCFLVLHFVKDVQERINMFRDMGTHLAPGGYLVNAEISYDMDSPQFPEILSKWMEVQVLMGAQKESLDKLPELLRTNLLVVSPEKTQNFMEQAGFPRPILFFQNILIHAWFARKSSDP